MKEVIKTKIINYLKNAGADRYGQLSTMDVYSVFQERTKEVLQYLKTDPIIRVTTYGGRYGSYEGIGGLFDIFDEEIRMEAEKTWKENENRIRNLNQW